MLFGTLLGDNNFIDHNIDIDIGFFGDNYYELIIDIINNGYFMCYGMKLIRNSETLISLEYMYHYIDFYFFRIDEKNTEYISGSHYGVKKIIYRKKTILIFVKKNS